MIIEEVLIFHEFTQEIQKNVLDAREMIIHLKNEKLYETLIGYM